MTLAEFWPLCLRQLHSSLTEQQFNTWIEPLTVADADGEWVVYGKSQFTVNLLKNQFAEQLNRILNETVPNHSPFVFKEGKGQKYTMADVQNNQTAFASAAVKAVADSDMVVELQSQKPAAAKSAKDILAQHVNASSSVVNSDGVKGEKTEFAEKLSEKISAQVVKSQHDANYERANLSPDYTFETLVEGKGNRIAAAAAQSIAENPGQSYNPFFLYGSTGLGKTHLVQAVGNALLKNNPEAKVRYMHSDDYIRSFMNAVRTNSYDVFKQQYKQYDLLIIDDIQFIKGKDRTMEEFFYLYNHFHNEKKQLILTCDVLPTKIEDMDDRLKSRFSWGLTLELEPPELEMRVAILQKKAEAAKVELDEQAAFFIAKHVRTNVRELEGAFKRVEARSRFLKKAINIDLATEALQDIVASSYKMITAESVMDAVAKYYRIKISDILGKKRTRNLARPRQVAMSLTKELTNLSLPSIGEAFGGRDHTTVMHGVKAVAKLRAEDPELAQDYEKLLIIIQN